MTNKEFFLKVMGDERMKFRKIIEALPDDKTSYKVHDKSREAGSLGAQLAIQWAWISQTAASGKPDFSSFGQTMTVPVMLETFDKNYDQMIADVTKAADSDWETGDADMGDWKTKKYDMAWGFLFDAIHHRGQLSTFLRNMGAKVPAVYGPSADSPM